MNVCWVEVFWRTECLSHGTVTQEYWLFDLGESLWRGAFDAWKIDAGWFLTHRIVTQDDFWRRSFFPCQLTHFLGGWFLTHFSFVHVIWRNFWVVSWCIMVFRCRLTQNTFCMHFDLVFCSVYVKFKVYATCFWTFFSCLRTAFPVFKHPFPVLERPYDFPIIANDGKT